jgi:spore maturation protein CgeB
VWIGNWGDEERTQELRDFWLGSARALPGLKFVAHGVRYPDYALAELADAGVEFRGWAPSVQVPEVFARSRATLHVPRRAYVQALAGIPTIRVFEALACGIPLVCAPWSDAEGLFRAGDYAVAESPAEMRAALLRLCRDEDAARAQAERGRETILSRHTCDHRAAQLLDIIAELGAAGSAGVMGAASADETAGTPAMSS